MLLPSSAQEIWIPSELLNDLDYKEELEAAIESAKMAGNNISQAFISRNQIVNTKDEHNVDFVTSTDQENERQIFRVLRKRFPDYDFIGEESCSENGSIPTLTDKPTWIIDPIDGTTNFVHAFPFCCVGIGLCVKRKVS